jgi:hypothetical protein
MANLKTMHKHYDVLCTSFISNICEQLKGKKGRI